jgi:hypothetical protein
VIVVAAERRRSILIATCTALMAVVASASRLNVAQQDLTLDLDASQSGVLLVINAYIVVLAATSRSRAACVAVLSGKGTAGAPPMVRRRRHGAGADNALDRA